ncbi:tetraacyldisaccharide 4'-kinase [candidate division KSB1 bacterium]|nr:tetraacyldisaccharide 4'-kinase [candidate division KSB1 bacterium]
MRFFEHRWPVLLLWPLSLIYCIVVTVRNILYDFGCLKSYAVDAFVISVGNITVGGTGKTPVVHYLANQLLSLNKRVAIISRGYGRRSRHTVVVADGRSIKSTVEDSGDEPFLLAQMCRNAVVVVDSNRLRAAEKAILDYKPDVIILDDAFQHRRIKRDIDLLTFRLRKPFGNGFCLPAGPLREPKRNIRRAQAILCSGAGQQLPATLAKVTMPLFFADYTVRDIVNKKGASILRSVRGKRAYAFCGLAHPEGFRRTLQELGVNLLGFTAFKDHYRFGQNDILKLQRKVKELSADIVVTTDKDWVKLPLDLIDEHWFRLQIELKPADEEKFLSLFEILK